MVSAYFRPLQCRFYCVFRILPYKHSALPSPLSDFLFAGLCRLLIGENYAQGDQHGAEDAHEGNFFAQQQPAYHHGNEGGGIQIVVGNNHAQVLKGDIPQSKTHGVAEHAQKQPAQQDTRLGKQRGQAGHTVGDEHQRHRCQKRPQEHPAGHQEIIIPLGILLNEDGVYRPHQGRRQGQQVSQRAQMEGQCAVQHHHDNAGDGHHCAHIHPFAQLLPPTGEKLRQDHRDDGDMDTRMLTLAAEVWAAAVFCRKK